MISIKIHTSVEGTVLAACDKELLGKKFREKELKLHVKEDFYSGEVISIENFEEKLKNADIVNLVGERVVGKAIELGLVQKQNVLHIEGIPHAQICTLTHTTR